MDYQPKPLDVDMNSLPPELEGLVEVLAENVHDQWALERMQQGWTWGNKRDDDNKHHPCLVPYNMLPDNEKLYDRNTARRAILTLMAMGAKIIYNGKS